MDKISAAKQTVLQFAKKAYGAGLFAATSGNLSVCLRSEGLVAITPTSVRYETMQAEDIVLIDLAGNIKDGRHKPSSEYLLHLALYNAQPETGAVVHTHSPYATAFAVNNRPIPLVLIEMQIFLGGEMPVAPLARPGSAAVGEGVVKHIGGRGACLLANHGVVAVGHSMDEAYTRAEYAEDAAKICSLALQNGPIVEIPPEMWH